MHSYLSFFFLPRLLYLKSLPGIMCLLPPLGSNFCPERGKMFLVSSVPNDTTPPALLCLQYFSSFRVILLSRRQHYTELTYIFPEPLIHSPKSIRYSLFPRKSIRELHSVNPAPAFFFLSCYSYVYNPQVSFSVSPSVFSHATFFPSLFPNSPSAPHHVLLTLKCLPSDPHLLKDNM